MDGFGESPVNPFLTGLPPELLRIVIDLLSAADQRSLAGTCSQLRASVLLQAKKLRLHLGSSQYTATAALLAAIRREHGPAFHLKLRLMGNVSPDELRALGNCPDVDQLELEFIPDFQNWTCEASVAVLQVFPNFRVLTLTHCQESLAQLAPMLQRPEPLEALQLDDTSAGIQLVSVARPTTDWPVQLLSLTGFKRLTMWNSHGRYYHFSETPPSGSQLSAVLTHIALGQTDLGLGPGGTGLSDWLDVIKRLPALEVFEAPKDEVLTLGLFRDFPTVLPRLRVLRLPSVEIFHAGSLKGLLSHPSLEHVELHYIRSLHDDVASDELSHLAAGRLQKLELDGLCCAAFAYLPEWALDCLVLAKGCTELCLRVNPFRDIPGFTSADSVAQVDWATLDTAVARLGPRLARLCPTLHLEVSAAAMPDRDHPQLRELCTSRILQLAQRLQPLSAWEDGVGVKSATLVRYQCPAKEVEALQAALGPGCRVEATSW